MFDISSTITFGQRLRTTFILVLCKHLKTRNLTQKQAKGLKIDADEFCTKITEPTWSHSLPCNFLCGFHEVHPSNEKKQSSNVLASMVVKNRKTLIFGLFHIRFGYNTTGEESEVYFATGS